MINFSFPSQFNLILCATNIWLSPQYYFKYATIFLQMLTQIPSHPAVIFLSYGKGMSIFLFFTLQMFIGMGSNRWNYDWLLMLMKRFN